MRPSRVQRCMPTRARPETAVCGEAKFGLSCPLLFSGKSKRRDLYILGIARESADPLSRLQLRNRSLPCQWALVALVWACCIRTVLASCSKMLHLRWLRLQFEFACLAGYSAYRTASKRTMRDGLASEAFKQSQPLQARHDAWRSPFQALPRINDRSWQNCWRRLPRRGRSAFSAFRSLCTLREVRNWALGLCQRL